ncbi:Protein of unknown function DUF2100 [Methanocaldococcus infernus ME]|uniref:DUF2100 domain-containing protein n=1 Tax=Methanocaldococcus infernus (strain DSM 11812 / JCM 15783 / ME) TaxID=573063 RepID=D5VT50_METIM|nr:DUF2100 domain-containing protein [Methanocaldococcus infernus]ADG13753.1 Protein of unknown function DUF2100 [Methanocaldococcus infernus ME]
MREKSLIKKGIETITLLSRRKVTEERRSYNEARAGTINTEEFKKAIHYLIEADSYLYKKSPKFYLNDEEAKEFCKLIFKAKDSLDKVLSNFGFSFYKEEELDESSLYIVSNRKLFKKLKSKNKNLKVVCTEGLLDIEDFKKIGVPESALKSLEKKVEMAKKNIERFIEKYKPNKIYVVVEDEKDNLLFERAKKLYNAEKVEIDEL